MNFKHLIHNWIVITLGLLLFTGCKKEAIDYRDAYIGNWDFRVYRTELNTDSIGFFYSDTVYYSGVIAYGGMDNEILIEYTNENSITLTMDDKGLLSGFPTNYCNGEFFKTDSLHLYLRWGGLGGGRTHQIEGIKE